MFEFFFLAVTLGSMALCAYGLLVSFGRRLALKPQGLARFVFRRPEPQGIEKTWDALESRLQGNSWWPEARKWLVSLSEPKPTARDTGIFTAPDNAREEGVFVKVHVFSMTGAVLQTRYLRKKAWGIPGGRVEKGETLEQAAARELLERTGYEVPVDALDRWKVEGDTVHFRAFEISGKQVASPGERGGYRTRIRWATAKDLAFSEDRVCQTPETNFTFVIKPEVVEVRAELPVPNDLSEAQAKRLEDDLHDAVEEVLANHLKF